VQGVVHPLFVHLHIALLFMAFVTMYYWLFKGLATSIFENRIYSLTRFNTAAGLIFVLLSMAVGIRDGLAGYVVSFNSPLGKWLYVKAALAPLIVVYSAFLWQSRKKRQYLQEDTRVMIWCLATQLVGFLLVAAVTTLGTMLVFYAHLLRRFGG
jgi:uncharacterized membrane protein